MFQNKLCYYSHKDDKTSEDAPPLGSIVIRLDKTKYTVIQAGSVNDMNMSNKKLGPIGANIFIFHIPNDLK